MSARGSTDANPAEGARSGAAERVSVDAGLCRGHRQCVFVAPDLIEVGPDGVPRQRAGAELADHRRAADDAALFCPENAVSIRAGTDPARDATGDDASGRPRSEGHGLDT